MWRLVPVTIAVASLGSSDLRAWGGQGHRVIGLIAAHHLTPAARAQVAWLLDNQTLAGVSTWADDYRDSVYQTFSWHFVDIPLEATRYDRDRDCPRQPRVTPGARADVWRDCIVDRIAYNQERLGNPKLDRADRAVALKFLVHFVGDLHQPFHALGFEDGANGVLVSWMGSPNCSADPARPIRCNLHAVWDGRLIGQRRLDDGGYAGALEALITQKGWQVQPAGTPAAWATQSFQLSKAALLPQNGHADQAYYEKHIAIVDEQLALAGLRLAAVLNAILK